MPPLNIHGHNEVEKEEMEEEEEKESEPEEDEDSNEDEDSDEENDDEEEEEEEETVECIEGIERPLAQQPILTSGYARIHKVLNGDPGNFRQVYRVYPNVFRKLCSIIREKTHLQDTIYISVEEMLATFLLIVGRSYQYRRTHMIFRQSHQTTPANFCRMLRALKTIGSEMMAKPGSTVPAKIRDNARFYPYFKDCIGAIKRTYIPAMIVEGDVNKYRNHRGKISQYVFGACNFDLEFIYALSGWEGSAFDEQVLNNAISRRNGFEVPQGKFVLVDCGIDTRGQFLAPFRGVRYHLREFSGEGHEPNNADELFNLRHASLRNINDKIFDIFKSRFRIFKSAPPFPFNIQAELVLACVGLHNFLRKECPSDEFPIELDNNFSSLPRRENAESPFEADEDGWEDANRWRTGIASDMWKDLKHDDNGGNNEG